MTSPYLHQARLISIGGVLAAALVFAGRLEATTIVYTFEGPQFTVGSSTPLLNVAPNVGDPTFRTDFTSAPTTNGLDIAAFQPNPLFSGNSLFDPFGPVDPLLLTFSSPVFALTVDFAVNLPQDAAGGLSLFTPVGFTTQPLANVGGVFPGGTLSFASPVPFSTAQISGFGPGRGTGGRGGLALFAIDDLTLSTTPVPEPTTLILIVAGAALAGIRHNRIVRRRDTCLSKASGRR
jgi:hypothetical protein